jgi:hypothetical protein
MVYNGVGIAIFVLIKLISSGSLYSVSADTSEILSNNCFVQWNLPQDNIKNLLALIENQIEMLQIVEILATLILPVVELRSKIKHILCMYLENFVIIIFYS